MTPWQPNCWQHAKNAQPVEYAAPAALQDACRRLASRRPIVTPEGIQALQQQLIEASQGQRMILHAGECAEQFSQCQSGIVRSQWHLLDQLARAWALPGGRPVTVIARLAGQYAKPRTDLAETQDGVTYPAYRGDLINGAAFDVMTRQTDACHLLTAYQSASRTWHWLQAHARATGRLADTFISHECLHLPYAQALTRRMQAGYYYAATHLPWIGMRCLFRGSAQLEYVRGIQNPIGLKIGPNLATDQLVAALKLLNPQRQPGRIVLIHRLGVAHIQRQLPALYRAVERANQLVVWLCDPLHGNTQRNAAGQKQRSLQAIQVEWQVAQQLHQQAGVPLAGIHLEVTPARVIECGQAASTSSLIDPRLNGYQALRLINR